MRVNPTGTSPIVPNSGASAARTTASTTESPGTASEPNSFAPSADLAALLTAVRQAPEVRPEAVAAATANLSAGNLQTRQAAADSAKSLLDSGDLGRGE